MSLRRLWTLPANLLAVLVARTCGVRLALRQPGFGAVLLPTDCWLARWLGRGGFVAITIGPVALVRVPLTTRQWLHERAHARQWARWGPLMLVAYPAASAWAWMRRGHVYRDNHFEIAARAEAETGSVR